jgi:hypothetical protein
MSEKIIPGSSESTQEILASLTPREAKVLRERFGIDLEGVDEDESKQIKSFSPSSGNNGGQGGAPQVAIAPAPSLQDKKYNRPSKAPRFTKH